MDTLDQNFKVTQDTLTVLERFVASYREQAVKFLVARKKLNPGEDLDQLSEYWAKTAIRMGERFWACCCPEEAKRLQEEKEWEKQQTAKRVLLERRIRTLSNMRPAEYQHLAEDESPRPRQFKLVAEFLSSEDSPYYISDKVSKKCGLVLFGKARTGKTAAAWEAVKRYWLSEPESSVEFIKTVRFVRLAKSRHLGFDAKSAFEELFERMLCADLLVLDDLGTEKLSESAEEVLFELLDSRTEDGRFTIITTNYTLEELAQGFLPKDREKIAGRLDQFFLPICFDKP